MTATTSSSASGDIAANKRATRRIVEEIFNQGRLDVADEVFAANYTEHAPLPPGIPAGLPGFRQFVTALRTAFPDFHYTLEDQIAEGDRLAVRVTAHGTHRGDFMGMPATGKQATWTEIHTARCTGGKVVEHWVNIDQIGMLAQLGLIPPPGQAPAH